LPTPLYTYNLIFLIYIFTLIFCITILIFLYTSFFFFRYINFFLKLYIKMRGIWEGLAPSNQGGVLWIINYVNACRQKPIWMQDIGEQSICRFDATRYAKGYVPVAELREEMQRTMQKYCGVFRTCDILQRGCREMTRLYTCDLPDLCVSC